MIPVSLMFRISVMSQGVWRPLGKFTTKRRGGRGGAVCIFLCLGISVSNGGGVGYNVGGGLMGLGAVRLGMGFFRHEFDWGFATTFDGGSGGGRSGGVVVGLWTGSGSYARSSDGDRRSDQHSRADGYARADCHAGSSDCYACSDSGGGPRARGYAFAGGFGGCVRRGGDTGRERACDGGTGDVPRGHGDHYQG